MDLSVRFATVASGDAVPIDTLDEGRRHPVTLAHRQVTVRTVYSADLVGRPSNIKVFLPERFTEVFQDNDIELNNNDTRIYHLVYHDRYPNGRSYKLILDY